MGGKVNTALITGSSRSGMDHHRMDTGMRGALEMVMRQLVNDVSVVKVIFNPYVPPSDSFPWKGEKGSGPVHAAKVDVAQGDGWIEVIEVSTD